MSGVVPRRSLRLLARGGRPRRGSGRPGAGDAGGEINGLTAVIRLVAEEQGSARHARSKRRGGGPVPGVRVRRGSSTPRAAEPRLKPPRRTRGRGRTAADVDRHAVCASANAAASHRTPNRRRRPGMARRTVGPMARAPQDVRSDARSCASMAASPSCPGAMRRLILARATGTIGSGRQTARRSRVRQARFVQSRRSASLAGEPKRVHGPGVRPKLPGEIVDRVAPVSRRRQRCPVVVQAGDDRRATIASGNGPPYIPEACSRVRTSRVHATNPRNEVVSAGRPTRQWPRRRAPPHPPKPSPNRARKAGSRTRFLRPLHEHGDPDGRAGPQADGRGVFRISPCRPPRSRPYRRPSRSVGLEVAGDAHSRPGRLDVWCVGSTVGAPGSLIRASTAGWPFPGLQDASAHPTGPAHRASPGGIGGRRRHGTRR